MSYAPPKLIKPLLNNNHLCKDSFNRGAVSDPPPLSNRGELTPPNCLTHPWPSTTRFLFASGRVSVGLTEP